MVAGPEFISFINKCPSPYHVAAKIKEKLSKSGFEQFFLGDAISRSKGGKTFFHRDGLIVAIDRPISSSDNCPFLLIASHTDSPCFRLRPASKHPSSENLKKLAVQSYGGGLWHTWFDRDMTLAGIMAVENEDGSKIQTNNLVYLEERPVGSIPSLAIHMKREQNETFQMDKETEMVPFIGFSDDSAGCGLHDASMIKFIAEQTGVIKERIVDVDLYLVPFEKATIGGLSGEFVHSARLDNLTSSFAAVEAICATSDSRVDFCRIVAWFDHEEIGSKTMDGAFSAILRQLIEAHDINIASSISKSFMISADAAHAVHPSYRSSYAKDLNVWIGKGPALKNDYNGAYISTMKTSLLIREMAKAVGIPIQDSFNENNRRGGSTVGPIISGQLGLRGVDLGVPILAMHSIREMGSVADVDYLTNLLKVALSKYSEFAKKFE